MIDIIPIANRYLSKYDFHSSFILMIHTSCPVYTYNVIKIKCGQKQYSSRSIEQNIIVVALIKLFICKTRDVDGKQVWILKIRYLAEMPCVLCR